MMRDNLAEFAESIPEYLLPATLKDAVRVTRDLGIRYLWIGMHT